MARKTFFNAEGKTVVIRHGCKTIKMDIKQAMTTHAEFNQAIIDANAYQPTILDLVKEFSSTLSLIRKYYPRKKKKDKLKPFENEAGAVRYLQRNIPKLTKLADIISKISKELDNEDKIGPVIKFIEAEDGKRMKELQKEYKDALRDAKFLNQLIVNNLDAGMTAIPVPETPTPQNYDDLFMAIENTIEDYYTELNEFSDRHGTSQAKTLWQVINTWT